MDCGCERHGCEVVVVEGRGLGVVREVVAQLGVYVDDLG